MKYRIYRCYIGYTVQKSRLGLRWRSVWPNSSNLNTLEEARDALAHLRDMGPVK